jgi:RND family efflux transporter MFP subunit
MRRLLRTSLRFLLIAALAVGAGAFVVSRAIALFPSDPKEQDRIYHNVWVVVRTNLTETVTLRGGMQAQRSARLKPRPRQHLLISHLIDEGTSVKKGDLLARFDGGRTKDDLDRIAREIDKAGTRLLALEATLAIDDMTTPAEILKAKITWLAARRELERYEEGRLPMNDRMMRLAVDVAVSEERRVRVAAQNVPGLVEKGYLASARIREANVLLRRKEVNLSDARYQLKAFKRYTSPLELSSLKAQARQTEVEYRTAGKRLARRRISQEAKILKSRSQLKFMQKKAKDLANDLARMEIRAPLDGVVIYGEPGKPWMRRRIRVGGRVGRWVTMFTLPDLSKLLVRFRVEEAWISHYKPGMAVRVDVESCNRRGLTGRITKVPEVTATGDWRADPAKKYFEIDAEIDETIPGIRSGVTAQVHVDLFRHDDVLTVPLHALRGEGDESFVYVVRPAQEGVLLVKTPVKTGVASRLYVEVTEGLRTGDRVFLGIPPVELLRQEEAQKAKQQSRKKTSAAKEKKPKPAAPEKTRRRGGRKKR